MLRRPVILGLVPALLLAACGDSPTAPEPQPAEPQIDPHLIGGLGGINLSAGAGTFNAGGPIVTFSYAAAEFRNGVALGHLHFQTVLGGLPIEFRGRVTCLSVDRTNHRAWVGAVITQNASTHPSFSGAIHQVGRDIWFRVVDYGTGPQQTRDRSTFVGFEGSAGFITSADYCAGRPWPGPPTDVPDARTNALLSGNIIVH